MKNNLTAVIHKGSQQVVQVNEKTKTFQVKDEMEKSFCLMSYEPEFDKDKILFIHFTMMLRKF